MGMGKTDEDRAKRLAEALRHNLRRRKAQARGESLPEIAPGAPARDRGRTEEE
jgi:hypothetical protein